MTPFSGGECPSILDRVKSKNWPPFSRVKVKNGPFVMFVSSGWFIGPGGLTQVDFRTAWLLPNTQRGTYSSTHGHWFESVLFAIKVLRVIGLFPCQLDHAFEFWPMIKLIAIQSLWYTGRYERCVIRLQGELRNHFGGELCIQCARYDMYSFKWNNENCAAMCEIRVLSAFWWKLYTGALAGGWHKNRCNFSSDWKSITILKVPTIFRRPRCRQIGGA